MNVCEHFCFYSNEEIGEEINFYTGNPGYITCRQLGI